MSDEKTRELIAEARRLPKEFEKAQLGETRYLEEDDLAELDAVGYLAVDCARRLADALEAERANMQALAKWVKVPEDTPSLEIACEVSSALEATLAAPVLDEGKIAEVIERVLREDTRLCYPNGGPVDWGRLGQSLARAVVEAVASFVTQRPWAPCSERRRNRYGQLEGCCRREGHSRAHAWQRVEALGGAR